MSEKQKFVLALGAAFVVGMALIASLFLSRPARDATPQPAGLAEELSRRHPARLPRPEELGIVLPPGAPGPAPDPDPVVNSVHPAVSLPVRSTGGAGRERSAVTQEEPDHHGSITPTAEELEEMKKKGAVAY